MVAVILAVAITVVLAAVLYVLILSLTHTGGTVPLGSEFAWGTPSNDTSAPSSGCTAAGHYCYDVELVVTGGSVRVNQFTLALQTPTGTPVGWPTSVTATGGTVTLISPTTALAVAQYWPLNSTWQLVAPFTGVLGSGFSLVIYCGGAAEGASQGLWGLELVAVGTGGYSGTVPSPVFS
jgi:FlaG/FlaF family flagellin (archaellin)